MLNTVQTIPGNSTPNIDALLKSLEKPPTGSSVTTLSSIATPSVATSSVITSSIATPSVSAPTIKPAFQIINPNTISKIMPNSAVLPPTKIVVVAPHCQNYTGSSKVSWNLINILSKVPNFDIHHFAIQKNNSTFNFRPYNIVVKTHEYSGANTAEFAKYVEEIKPNIVIIYNNTHIVADFMEALNTISDDLRSKIKVVSYLTQAFCKQTTEKTNIINSNANEIFVASNFWRQVLTKQGVVKPVGIMPYGFDKDIQKPIDKMVARKMINISTDAFLIVSVNRNNPRKRYDLLIIAFANFISKHPEMNVNLLCICDSGKNGGYPIIDIFKWELQKLNLLSDQHINKLLVISNHSCHTDETINVIYNSADIGISCADGENFGLCNFEMMGLGKPQILPDHGAFSEYANSTNSIIVPTKHVYYTPNCYGPIVGEAQSCAPEDLAAAMEQYILNPELVASHGKAARECVLKYSWATCSENLLACLRRL